MIITIEKQIPDEFFLDVFEVQSISELSEDNFVNFINLLLEDTPDLINGAKWTFTPENENSYWFKDILDEPTN